MKLEAYFELAVDSCQSHFFDYVKDKVMAKAKTIQAFFSYSFGDRLVYKMAGVMEMGVKFFFSKTF